MELAGQRVVVIGLGASGRAAAELASRRGADVVGVDLRADLLPIPGVRLELGHHRRDTFLGADLLVVSPGIPLTQPDVAAARAAGVPLLGELAFAWALLCAREGGPPNAAAITGTNGKSSVTSFTGQLLQASGRSAFVGGNLGTPLSAALLSDEHVDAWVIEVSSYQLELAGDLAPRVAAWLNLTPDHLARHGTIACYAATKAKLFAKMAPGAGCLVPQGSDVVDAALATVPARRWLRLGGAPGVQRVGRRGVVATGEREAWSVDLSLVPLFGEHNLDNALVAAWLAVTLGAERASVQAALGALKPLAHRMEQVPSRDRRVWINDSKATNVDAARVGLLGLSQRAVVLLGGEAKAGDDFAALAPLLGGQRAVLCFGASGADIAQTLRAHGVDSELLTSLEAAVRRAAALAQPHEAVLLSPGCASFDAYQNFERRGEHFAALVREIA